MSHEYLDNKILEELLKLLREGNRILRRLFPDPNNELVLTIPNQQGDTDMGAPVSLTVGNGTVQASVQEFLNGNPEPNNGPISYASDTPSVATVDPVAGVVTPVAAGVANISAADSANQLTDSVAVTVLAGGPPPPVLNNSMTLTIPPQASSSSSRSRF